MNQDEASPATPEAEVVAVVDPLAKIIPSAPSQITCREDLDEIILRHELWLESVVSPRMAITGGRANLNGTCLDGFDLSGVNLSGASFVKASLKGTVMVAATLRGCDFTQADLEGANFRNAKLNRSKFVRANLVGAEFDGADTARADFQWATRERKAAEAAATEAITGAEAGTEPGDAEAVPETTTWAHEAAERAKMAGIATEISE